mgnify:CR=1 FL=1
MIKLSEFKYSIGKDQIAEFPADPRDNAKMLVVDRESGELMDLEFKNIVDFFKKGDCLVLNDTKVFPARLFGKKEKTNAMIEVLLLRELNKEDRIWDVLVEPARKVRIGNKIYFDNNKFYCEVIDNTTSRGRTVRFSYEGDLFKVIERIGQMPLPEYIKRDPNEHDKNTYQTVFANSDNLSSIAPPKGGLHFTEEILQALEEKGVRIARINLTIGQGIFEKIEVEDLTKHRMYSEEFNIGREASEMINKSLKAKKNVFAAGTSVLRALESSVLTSGACKPNRGWTDKFIYPQYDFKIATRLITNFQESASPQLLVSSAFAGKETIFKAYEHAKKNGYRFLAYGDSVLII